MGMDLRRMISQHTHSVTAQRCIPTIAMTLGCACRVKHCSFGGNHRYLINTSFAPPTPPYGTGTATDEFKVSRLIWKI